jgi:uncharacterized protein YacL
LRKSAFVEISRLLIVLLCTFAGYELAGRLGAPLLGVTMGAGVGYVSGGLLGRFLMSWMGGLEERVVRSSAGEFLTGAVGAVLVGTLATLIGVATVGLLPGRLGWPVFALVIWIGVYAGYRIASTKSRELLALAGLSDGQRVVAGSLKRDAVLLDTSVLIDGRLLQVARSGFLHRDLLVPRFVLDELHELADSREVVLRRKGRRALETLDALKRDRLLRLQVPEDEIPELEAVDAKLVALATRLSVGLLTNDQALASIAEIRGVRCLNLHRLTASLRPFLLPGESVSLSISKEGRQPGEGVGFLNDGSMVVVADASRLVGQQAEVRITGSARTPVGRTFFASLERSRSDGPQQD